jgi:prevent-host-death family protein
MEKRARVGVRELRQYLSVYLERVKAGETLEVTERGTPVGVLAPLPEHSSFLERMIAQGRATRPTGSRTALRGPITLPLGSPTTMEILDELREDKI